MSARMSRKSYRVRLPDGTEIGDWAITRDVMDAPDGIVEWCIMDGGIGHYWECHFRDCETQGDVIIPSYDEAPRLVEIASGVDLLWSAGEGA